MELAEQLRGFKVLGELNDRELKQLARIARLATKSAGDRIAAEKALATALYLVVDGRVEIRMSRSNNESVTIDSVGPGETFGWSAVADSNAFTAAIWVVEDVRLIKLDGDALRALFEADNHIGYRVMKGVIGVVSRRVHALQTKFAANTTTD